MRRIGASGSEAAGFGRGKKPVARIVAPSEGSGEGAGATGCEGCTGGSDMAVCLGSLATTKGSMNGGSAT